MIELSRSYTSRNGLPIVNRIDPRIFTLRYFSECMNCTFCFDSCCQYGCNVSPVDEANIMKHASALEKRVGRPSSEWFDHEWEDTVNYAGGRIMRTRLYDKRRPDGLPICVFTADPGGRGCMLHSYAMENGLSPFDVKPEDCHIFPLYYEDGSLIPALELDEESLVCQGKGETLFRSVSSTIAHIFGDELLEELRSIEARVLGASGQHT